MLYNNRKTNSNLRRKPMLELVKPSYEQLAFRQALLADEKTMSYNAKWGGTIDFTPDRWESWYRDWISCAEGRFYRYLYSPRDNAFVGEIAYHFDEEYRCYICNVIVHSHYRGNGFGKIGLLLLLEEAKKAGISVVYDNIAADNTAIRLFKQCGFTEKWRNKDIIMLERIL